tara:strand:+ start:555 stop:833 length:279 start_codon:yes stop_codon:yes gene_type:complete
MLLKLKIISSPFANPTRKEKLIGISNLYVKKIPKVNKKVLITRINVKKLILVLLTAGFKKNKRKYIIKGKENKSPEKIDTDMYKKNGDIGSL